jgi:hypothetical protein
MNCLYCASPATKEQSKRTTLGYRTGTAMGDGGEFDQPFTDPHRAGFLSLGNPDRSSLPGARLHPSSSSSTFTHLPVT